MSLERLHALRTALHVHNRRYYVEDQPTISDAEFDSLLRELQALEDQYPEVFDPNSPTQRVGGAVVKSFETVAHKRPMLSLSNSYNAQEVVDAIKKKDQKAQRYS